MKEQFIPYNLALKLKELGFNEVCLANYNNLTGNTRLLLGKTDEGCITWNKTPDKYNTIINSNERILAPLWQQAFDFVLNKFDLVGTVYANASGYLYEIHDSATKGGTHRAESGYDGDCEYSGTYTTYHKGRLACLEKLIELCNKINKI